MFETKTLILLHCTGYISLMEGENNKLLKVQFKRVTAIGWQNTHAFVKIPPTC